MCKCIALSTQGQSVAFTLSSGEQLEGRLHQDFKDGVVWQGRCLNLEWAYCQVPVLESLLSPRFFISNSLPFGAGASVFSFNRVSRSLLRIPMHVGRVIGGVFYENIPFCLPRSCVLSPSKVSWTFWAGHFPKDPANYKPFSEYFAWAWSLMSVPLPKDLSALPTRPHVSRVFLKRLARG